MFYAGVMESKAVNPPQLVWITGFGNPTQGMLVEWRKRQMRGHMEWAGVIVHVVTYASQDGHEWSIRVDVMSESQFKPANHRGASR